MPGTTTDPSSRPCIRAVCCTTKVSTLRGMTRYSSIHSLTRHAAAIENLRGEDFDIQHSSSDPFNYLGNGELEWEREQGADLGYYLE